MTDRFDAQLRQHLLGTADERAADGQLATILEQVDATVQRPSLAARLTLWPGRIGPVPVAALRYGLVAAAVVATMLAALIFGSGSPGRPLAFEGTWTSIDPGDGSTQTLVVGNGQTPTVRYEDDVATAACPDDLVKVFLAEGAGEISGSRLVVRYPNGGTCGSATIAAGDGIFDYRADSDTLRDGQGVTWHRVRGGPLPTIPPGTEPAPSPSTVFEGVWTATDPADGSRLTLVVGAGVTPSVRFVDDLSTGGACVADEVKVFTADGVGEVSGSRLIAEYPDGGGCGTQTVGIGGSYEHRPGSDTLTDQDGVIWSRTTEETPAGSGPPPAGTPPAATAAPAASPSGPAAEFAFVPLPPYTCDLREGRYGGHIGGVLVTVTTPTTWHGLDDVFHAEDEGCGGGAGARIEVTMATEVYPDTCHWLGAGVEVGSPGWETAAFSEESLFEVTGPIETELGGHPARRYDFTLPDVDPRSCSGSVLQFWRDPARPAGTGPTIQDPGDLNVYFVEVDDATFGVYVFKGEGNDTPRIWSELDDVVESLRFER